MEMILNDGITKKEADAYVEQLKEKYPGRDFTKVEFKLSKDENGDEFVDINFDYDNIPFERIRRITGYLVGTLDRFNNAKRAEVEDRVKHNITTDNNEDLLKQID